MSDTGEELHRPGVPPQGRAVRHDGEFTLVSLTIIVLRHRIAIAVVALLVAAATGVAVLVKPRTYTSAASFIPQSARPTSSPISGLAAQFGIDVSGAAPGMSPAFYAELVRSRQLLEGVVGQDYTLAEASGKRTATLADLYAIAGTDSIRRRAAAVRRLQGDVTATFDVRTSVVAVEVRARYPDLAAEIAGNIVAAVNRFNLETRQSQARAEREFTEQRLADARADMRRAEDSLQGFLQRNRSLGSPALEFERDRLGRAVSLQQQVVSSLAQSYEQAKIDEVRDTPVITVLDKPEVPLLPDPRGLVVRVILAFLIGALIAATVAVMRDRAGAGGVRGTGDWNEMLALRAAAVEDLRHPIRAARRSAAAARK